MDLPSFSSLYDEISPFSIQKSNNCLTFLFISWCFFFNASFIGASILRYSKRVLYIEEFFEAPSVYVVMYSELREGLNDEL